MQRPLNTVSVTADFGPHAGQGKGGRRQSGQSGIDPDVGNAPHVLDVNVVFEAGKGEFSLDCTDVEVVEAGFPLQFLILLGGKLESSAERGAGKTQTGQSGKRRPAGHVNVQRAVQCRRHHSEKGGHGSRSRRGILKRKSRRQVTFERTAFDVNVELFQINVKSPAFFQGSLFRTPVRVQTGVLAVDFYRGAHQPCEQGGIFFFFFERRGGRSRQRRCPLSLFFRGGRAKAG